MTALPELPNELVSVILGMADLSIDTRRSLNLAPRRIATEIKHTMGKMLDRCPKPRDTLNRSTFVCLSITPGHYTIQYH